MSALHELSVERRIAAPPAVVRRVWEERLAEWWCPKPWTTSVEALDLRPGGTFAATIRGPAGEVMPHVGVVLEAGPDRLVFTDALTPDWEPREPFMVSLFTFADDGAGGTLYRAAARHWAEEARAKHAAMGFAEGWGIVAGQLAALAEDAA